MAFALSCIQIYSKAPEQGYGPGLSACQAIQSNLGLMNVAPGVWEMQALAYQTSEKARKRQSK